MRAFFALLIFAFAPSVWAFGDLQCARADGNTGIYDSLEIRHLPSFDKNAEVTLVTSTEKTLARGRYRLVGGHGMVDTYRYTLSVDGTSEQIVLKVAYIPFTPIEATLMSRGQAALDFQCVAAP